MFTVNFKEEIDFQKILKKTKKAITKKWIENYLYCFEWRDKEKGCHLHLKVELEKDKNPYECKREMYNTFKELVGNKLHINCRYSNVENCFEDYIKGFKNGEVKKCLVFTIPMREKLKLEDWYSSTR